MKTIRTVAMCFLTIFSVYTFADFSPGETNTVIWENHSSSDVYVTCWVKGDTSNILTYFHLPTSSAGNNYVFGRVPVVPNSLVDADINLFECSILPSQGLSFRTNASFKRSTTQFVNEPYIPDTMFYLTYFESNHFDLVPKGDIKTIRFIIKNPY